MDLTIALTSSTLLLTVCYLIFSIYVNGWKVPQSLSETYYIFQTKGLGWLFPALMVVMAFVIMPLLSIELHGEWYQFFTFLITILTVFTGVSYDYKKDFNDSNIHYACAYILSGVVVLLNVLENNYLCLTLSTVLTIPFALLFRKSFILFLELALLLSLLSIIAF